MNKKINKNKILVPAMGIAGVVGTIPFISGCTLHFQHEEDDPATPTGVSLDKTTLNLISGLDGALNASVTPSTASQEVEWSSSNEDVATVNGGKIYTFKPGTATITVKPVGYDFTATCEVTVDDAITDTSSSRNVNVRDTGNGDYGWLGNFTIVDQYFTKQLEVSPTIEISFIEKSIPYFGGNLTFFGTGFGEASQAEAASFTQSLKSLSIRFYVTADTPWAMTAGPQYPIKLTIKDSGDGTILYENNGDGSDGKTPFTVTKTS